MSHPAGTKERSWSLIEGDAITAMRAMAACSVDAVITDPPYGIGFRREQWDTPTTTSTTKNPFEAWTCEWASECLRVLKPGGHLIAFGAPRTAHRLAAGVEDAGFELRDQLVWLYGSGVPKSRLHAGRASQLKPAYEPILLARKPLDGTLSNNEARWGTGRLSIDASRLTPDQGTSMGRWPANVTTSHDIDCRTQQCATSCPVAMLETKHTGSSRFFYCAKPSRAERDDGCQHLPARQIRIYGPRMPRPRRNTHPTVKPVALMRWLIRLACPVDGVVLDPFAGSGSTGVAGAREECRFVGIEQDPGYARIARARLRQTDPGGSG